MWFFEKELRKTGGGRHGGERPVQEVPVVVGPLARSWVDCCRVPAGRLDEHEQQIADSTADALCGDEAAQIQTNACHATLELEVLALSRVELAPAVACVSLHGSLVAVVAQAQEDHSNGTDKHSCREGIPSEAVDDLVASVERVALCGFLCSDVAVPYAEEDAAEYEYSDGSGGSPGVKRSVHDSSPSGWLDVSGRAVTAERACPRAGCSESTTAACS